MEASYFICFALQNFHACETIQSQPLAKTNNKNNQHLIRRAQPSRKQAFFVEIHASERAPAADNAAVSTIVDVYNFGRTVAARFDLEANMKLTDSSKGESTNVIEVEKERERANNCLCCEAR